MLALLLAIGLWTMWILGWMLAASATSGYFRGVSFKQLNFTVEGEALLRTYPAGNRDQLDPIYHTLDGKRVVDYESLHLNDSYVRNISPPELKKMPALNSWAMRMVGFVGAGPSRTFWYLIHDAQSDGSAYFVGYDYQTRQLVGYFARDGFRTAIPPADERFKISFARFQQGGWEPYSGRRLMQPNAAGSKRHNLFLLSGGELFKINLSLHTIEPVAMPDKVVSLGVYTQLAAREDDGPVVEEVRIVVRLANELRFLSEKGEPLGGIPITPKFRDQNIFLRGTTSGEFVLEVHSAKVSDGSLTLAWLSADGKELKQRVVQIRDPSTSSPFEAWLLNGLIPVPLALGVISVIAAVIQVRNGQVPDFAMAYAELIARFWLPCTLVLVVSLILAIWVYRRHGRYKSRDAATWAVLVLLLGPLGLVGYLLHRQWPARTTCEHCGKLMPRNRSTCMACVAEFLPPAMKGVEVFA
jgi:hypothetical protein